MNKEWSDQQKQIFSWFEHGGKSKSLVVRARAGTGKTTTILHGVNLAPERYIALCAFNKTAAEHLDASITNPNAECRTLHSLGSSIVRRFWPRVKVDNNNSRVREHASVVAGYQAPEDMIKHISLLSTKTKEMLPLADKPEDLYDLAYEFDCVPDAEWELDGWNLTRICECALKVLELATRNNGLIDFADMLFLPIRNGWVRGKYDLMVVDEAQDMSLSQIYLAQKSVRPGGRIAVIGDDRQGIYGFRGADSGSIDRLKIELKAEEMPLTTTYRCPKSIVSLAKALVPDYIAAPEAPQGTISTLPIGEIVNFAEPNDFILSRTNAPLMSICLTLLRAGIRTRMNGRAIADGLIALINKLKAKSIGDLHTKVRDWEERECARIEELMHGDAEKRIEAIRDKAETLRVLAGDLATVDELKARIKSLFEDDGRPYVVCSSVHRAKGLEADNVFVLEDTLFSRKPPACTCGHWAHEDDQCKKCRCKTYTPDWKRFKEEQNIEYVAITRAKHRLIWAYTPKA